MTNIQIFIVSYAGIALVFALVLRWAFQGWVASAIRLSLLWPYTIVLAILATYDIYKFKKDG